MVVGKVLAGIVGAGVPVATIATAVGVTIGSSSGEKSFGASESVSAPPKANYPKDECKLLADVSDEQEKLLGCSSGYYFLYSKTNDTSSKVASVMVTNKNEVTITLDKSDTRSPLTKTITGDKWIDFPKSKNLVNNREFPCMLSGDWGNRQPTTWVCTDNSSGFKPFTFSNASNLE